jgi:hypothetical protein
MSKRLDKAESLWKLRGIYSDALRAASCSGEFIALGQANTHLSMIGDQERLSKKKRSRYCPAIAQALELLSSSALSSCATDRLSARDGAEINRRVQSAPRSLYARRETFDSQQGKDVKAKQHWCPLKQDHPSGVVSGRRLSMTGNVRMREYGA